MRRAACALLCCVAALGVAVAKVDVYQNPNSFDAALRPLQVGDPAPPLKVDVWLRGEPVESFRQGQVYVVEFFASWCGPCRKSVPHLNALQAKHRQRGLTVIGVAANETDGVDALRDLVEAKGQTMDYTIAYTTHEETFLGWMHAARVSGLPWAFIVDRQGRVAWWGQPFHSDFEPALERVLSDAYDLAASRDARARAHEQRKQGWDLQAGFWKAYDAKDWQTALRIVDELLATGDEAFYYEAGMKFDLLYRRKGDREAGRTYARAALGGFLRDKHEALALMASIVAGSEGLAEADHALALELAQRASKLTFEQSPEVLRTLALVYRARGDKAAAAAALRQALPLAEETLRKELEQELSGSTEGASAP